MTKNVVLAFGTRPEATKMAPVYHALEKLDGINPIVLLTGQHKEQLEQALSFFNIPSHYNLKLMKHKQGLPGLASRILPAVAKQLKKMKADYVLVHGDTLTTFAVAWTAFMEKIPVGHVEAGLRSFNLREPFPEEANRRLTDVITDLDLAPTQTAKENLLEEGKSPNNIFVTGQTGIDAILLASRKGDLPNELREIKKPIITVTLHRRENWDVLSELAEALSELAKEFTKYHFVYPVHLNPVVQESVKPILKKVDNFTLLDPIEYSQMAALLSNSKMIITDSGGLQEEGAALNIPVVVVRNVTERPEGIESGVLKIAGNTGKGLFDTSKEILRNKELYSTMKNSNNPYGDGKASMRVAQAVSWKLGLSDRPQEWEVRG